MTVQYDEDKQEFFIDVGDKTPEELFEALKEIKEKLDGDKTRV